MINSTTTFKKAGNVMASTLLDDDTKEGEEDDEDEDEDEDDMKPMGIEEFRARVMGMK
jgi:hypothetical protein